MNSHKPQDAPTGRGVSRRKILTAGGATLVGAALTGPLLETVLGQAMGGQDMGGEVSRRRKAAPSRPFCRKRDRATRSHTPSRRTCFGTSR